MPIKWSSLPAVAFFLAAMPALLAQTSTAGAKQGADGDEAVVQVPSPLSLVIHGSMDFPIADSAVDFTFGGAGDVWLAYRIPQSVFFLSGGLHYAFAPIAQIDATASVAAAVAGGGIRFPIARGISALGYASGGYYFATYNDFSKNVTDPCVLGGLDLDIAIAPTFSITAGVQYKCYFGLYQGVSGFLGIDVALGNLGGSVDMQSLDLRPAFPVFYKHYDDHPIGTLKVTSRLKVPARDVKAQVYIKEFMDAPKSVDVCATLSPGESRTADLYALFTDKVLGVTEGTKVAAEITVFYKVEGQTYTDRKIETLSILGRNAMTWDDNAKAAAFVTAKEPQVLNFARSVTSFVRARENRAVNDNLQAAMALHEALDLYGINYTPNPVTPYAEASKQKDVVDFLQFPRETFQYKAGDCSDLSILYCSLLQAVGIDAAFITIPGHIFVAVNTGIPAEKASDALIPAGQFVPYKGKVWIPVEVTLRRQGFMKAWQLGAKEWNENTLSGLAGFYPIQDAWATYQPVGLPGEEKTINVPQSDTILAAYMQEVQKYIDAALTPEVARLQDEFRQSGSLAALNGLGVLYAKYGQADKAETAFKQVLSKKQYLPSILNLGNLFFLREDWLDASKFYQVAKRIVPGNSHVLLSLARVDQELQNYSEMKKEYEALKEEDPALAQQYAYLGKATETGARAADVATERAAVIWESGE